MPESDHNSSLGDGQIGALLAGKRVGENVCQTSDAGRGNEELDLGPNDFAFSRGEEKVKSEKW